MKKTAILIDGAFYRNRAFSCLGEKSPVDRAKELSYYCYKHLQEGQSLYRIFYYDCLPMKKKVFHPLLQKQIDFSETDTYKWGMDFIEELKHQRKFAIRLGKLAESQACYTLKSEVIKKLCSGIKSFSDLEEHDFQINVTQKGVDMKIGIDIASLAFKKQVDQIVLISGDSDFVPAAKLARREGIDFILDPLHAHIKPDLYEHIDGLRTCDARFRPK